MSKPNWTIVDRTARWSNSDFSAAVFLPRPDRGLHDVRLDGTAIDADLLGLVFPSALSERDLALQECHARGRDLLAQYPEATSWPICVDVAWRVLFGNPSRGILAGVDLIASVRTALLESWPELAVGSRMVADEAFQLVDAATIQFEPCAVAGAGHAAEPVGPGLFVARLARTPFSFAEMVHPADGQGSTASGSGKWPTLFRTRRRLFAERLEKGVLLRSRVRGLLLDRAGDLKVAADCYAEFAAADPPLGN